MRLIRVRVINYKSLADSGNVDLGQINVLVGRNNSGKSAFIRAVGLIQANAGYDAGDVRIGAEQCEVRYILADVSAPIVRAAGAMEENATVEASFVGTRQAPTQNTVRYSVAQGTTNIPYLHSQEPDNFIYTYLSKRKVTEFDQMVNRSKALQVSNNLHNLVSKVDRLANPGYPKEPEYTALCEKVLGYRIGSLQSLDGHQAGILTGDYDYIPIEAMGEGVSSLLGLITDLCMANGNLFLIEELENDIHPEGLKAILDVIIEKSANSQFIVSTHSNIVTKYLGSASDAKIFNVELDYQPGAVPTSHISEVEPTPDARTPVLRRLGYELYDFDLWEGWLILEESSAEVIIKDYLVPWFAPKLSRVRTVSAGGTGNLGATFADFRRLFLFTHLESQYKDRAWVIADGDDTGKQAIGRLRSDFKTWPEDHFQVWREADFERYYPTRFTAQVDATLAQAHDAKPKAKKRLLDEVKQWCDEHEAEARKAFEESASEVVEVLKDIEQELFR